MKFLQYKILENADLSQSTVISKGINVNNATNFSIQAQWTGTPTGTFKIQVSNDIVEENTIRNADPASNVVNWTDYTDSDKQVFGTSGDWVWLDKNAGYHWIRLVYTKISGTGSVTVTFNGKGV